MEMSFALLASGSKGNAFVLKEEGSTLMIDCGSTKSHLLDSLALIGQPIDEIDALLITHDHSDHISQIDMFSDLAIYSPVALRDIDAFIVRGGQRFAVGCFEILPVTLSHDALATVGYIISDGCRKLVYITDTGYLKESYYPLLRGADYIILESNHDVEMLMKTRRPQYLKSRIYGDEGHLNNEDCAAILSKIVTRNTKVVILAHISREANSRDKALAVSGQRLRRDHPGELNPQLVLAAAGQFEIIRKGETYEETDMGTCYCYPGLECHPER